MLQSLACNAIRVFWHGFEYFAFDSTQCSFSFKNQQKPMCGIKNIIQSQLCEHRPWLVREWQQSEPLRKDLQYIVLCYVLDYSGMLVFVSRALQCVSAHETALHTFVTEVGQSCVKQFCCQWQWVAVKQERWKGARCRCTWTWKDVVVEDSQNTLKVYENTSGTELPRSVEKTCLLPTVQQWGFHSSTMSTDLRRYFVGMQTLW